MTIEAEPFVPIQPQQVDPRLLAARRMSGAEWLTVADPEPPVAVEAKRPDAPAGILVDFTGHEDLLTEFKKAAEQAGLSPAESVLDLVYLFCNGDLHLKVDSHTEESAE